MLFLILFTASAIAINVQTVRAYGVIYIRADGSVDPSTAPILRSGDLYTLTGNIMSDADGIVIERNNITLDGAGFAINGSASVWSNGVYLFGTSNVTIKNMDIEGFHFGLNLQSSSFNHILRNTITKDSYGIELNSSNSNTLSENVIQGITQTAVELRDALDCRISGNNISSNWGGINLIQSGIIEDGDHNTISGNYITYNVWGISFSSYAFMNAVYHNNFIGNEQNVYPPPAGSSMNFWDNDYPSGGNCWSDYTGVDLLSGRYQNVTGSDGVGDTPYVIDTNNRDNYPLMGPFGVQVSEGFNATVFPSPEVGLIFDQVTKSGSATATVTTAAPPPPPGPPFLQPLYDIRVMAGFSGQVLVRIAYNPSGLDPQRELGLRLLQGDIVPGDINLDGVVDIRDLAQVGLSFGTYVGHPKWNPVADLNQDGRADILDLVFVARNFGKTSSWTDITTHVDAVSHVIYGITDHFSIFGIRG